MKLFKASQIKNIDKYTIEHEPISSHALMERAALKCTAWLSQKFSRSQTFKIFCGFGNNGGDGLAIARQLHHLDYQIETYLVTGNASLSPDNRKNLELLQKIGVEVKTIASRNDFPDIFENCIVIDALFGAGLNRPPEGVFAELIDFLNSKEAQKIAIDIPSGMPGDNITNNSTAFKADVTLTFQFPFIAFLLPENDHCTGNWEILDIGLHPKAIASEPSQYQLTRANEIFVKPRPASGHKGSFGHALVMAGSKGMAGAAILCAKACLKSGCGLVTAHVPAGLVNIVQTAFPEAMVSADSNHSYISELPHLRKFSSIAIGPGIGTNSETLHTFEKIIKQAAVPLVIDADGINLLAQKTELLEQLPQNTILTPHPGEFQRLFGKCSNSCERLLNQQNFSEKYGIIIVVKGRYTSISDCYGNVYFNTTGNNGMATAGSGDVLTGIIVSLLAQGYEPLDAAKTGVFLHGMAGDCAANQNGEHALIASDIIANLGQAYIKLNNL